MIFFWLRKWQTGCAYNDTLLSFTIPRKNNIRAEMKKISIRE